MLLRGCGRVDGGWWCHDEIDGTLGSDPGTGSGDRAVGRQRARCAAEKTRAGESCSGQAGRAGCKTSAASGQAAAWHQVTACIRANGMPGWPDPSVGPGGRLGFPADAPRTTDRVQRACARQFAALPPADTATAAPMSSHDLTMLVRLAQCLRAHGYPTWPDPGPDGRFPSATLIAIPGAKAALSGPPLSCRSLVPQAGIHVAS